MLRDSASRAPRPLYQLGYICDQPYFLIVVWTWRCSPTCLHWHHVLKGLASLSLLCSLGQLLRWGIHSPNIVFHPLRGDECSVNCISRFWSVILHHASI